MPDALTSHHVWNGIHLVNQPRQLSRLRKVMGGRRRASCDLPWAEDAGNLLRSDLGRRECWISSSNDDRDLIQLVADVCCERRGPQPLVHEDRCAEVSAAGRYQLIA